MNIFFPPNNSEDPCLLCCMYSSCMNQFPGCSSELLLYSPTKRVKQKYILYISGSLVCRQYIHKCSRLWSPNWLPAVSHSPPPLSFWTLPPQWLSAPESSLPHNDSQTPEPISSFAFWWVNLPSHSPLWTCGAPNPLAPLGGLCPD